MRQNGLLFALFFVIQSAKAQFAYPIQQDAVDFQKRALLVHLFEEDEKVVKNIKSKFSKNTYELTKNLELYSRQIQNQNEILKGVVSRYWKANKQVEFHTKSELDGKLKDHKTLRHYGVLTVGWRKDFQLNNNTTEPTDVFALVAYVAEATDRKYVELKRPTQKMDYIFKVVFPTDNLLVGDYIFAVQQFNYHLKNATTEGKTEEKYRKAMYVPSFNRAGYEVIKKKTLLLPSSVLDDGQDKEEIKKHYMFSAEIVAPNFFKEAIEQQFAKYLYITEIWSDRQSSFTFVVVSTSDGIILSELSAKNMEKKYPPVLLEEDPALADLYNYKSQIGISLATLAHLQRIVNLPNRVHGVKWR